MQTSNIQLTTQEAIKKPVLKQGARGEAVREVQDILADLGIYKGSIDGVFDLDVKNAVITFQHRVFLIEDGIVGPLTWQALYTNAPVNMPVLTLGSKGKNVVLLQNLLNTTKDYLGVMDGIFGPLTKVAVQAFQKRSSLVDDGIVGERTWKALSNVPH
ncbi:MAG TPA: peptidoglycan-binding protein [Coleofasciculaceae cyanobacterium]